VLDIVQVAGSY